MHGLNCFLDDFNSVFAQIRCLYVLLGCEIRKIIFNRRHESDAKKLAVPFEGSPVKFEYHCIVVPVVGYILVNSVDPDGMPQMWHLIWVYTVNESNQANK